MPLDWTLRTEDYTPGVYTVTVKARDKVATGWDDAAHVATQEYSDVPDQLPEAGLTVIVGVPPVSTADRMGLENHFHYKTTPTGAGSRANVNLANGNMVWQWLPLANPGRGLSTFGTLTYNSQSRVEDTLTPYDQIGKGFSLGISGLTRVNEPLDVSKADAGLVTLTDPDGTRHTFVSHDLETYAAPPGVHLRLRRYSAFGLSGTALAEPDKAWAATRPDGVTYYFDALGYATWIQDRNGNQIHFVYEYASAAGSTTAQVCTAADPSALGLDGKPLCVRRLVHVVDAAGVGSGAPHRSVDLTYDSNSILAGVLQGRVASITDHLGRAIDFSYTGGYLTAVTQGRRTRASDDGIDYDATRGFGFHYEDQDAAHPLATRYLDQVTDPRGAHTTFAFEPNSLTGLDPRRTLKVTARGSATPTQFAYEQQDDSCSASTCTTITDPRGKDTKDDLDDRGRLTSMTDARGTRTELEWDDPGNQACLLPQDDNQVCRLTEGATADPEASGGAAVTSLAYNGNGLLTYKRDPVGAVTTLTYRDGPGTQVSPRGTDAGSGFVSDLTSITSPRGNETSTAGDFTRTFSPDVKGNVTQQTDALGNVASTTFDSSGQVTSEQDWHTPDDQHPNTTSYQQYDANGLARIMVDARGNEQGADPVQHRWFYTYDDIGNLRRATDPRGATTGTPDSLTTLFTTRFRYDALDRVRDRIVPTDSRNGASITRSFEYDPNGNATARIDGRRRRWESDYTAMDQPKERRSPAVDHLGRPGPEAETTRYFYDENQNVTDVTRPKGVVSPTDNAFSTHYEYDAVNEPTSETRRSRDGTASDDKDLTTLYGWDERGNLATVRAPRNQDEPSSMGFYRVVYGYDLADHRVSQTEDAGDNGKALLTRMDYDADGHLTHQIDPRSIDTSNPSAYTTTYQYDANGRQTDTIAPGGDDTRTVLRPDGRVATLIKPNGFNNGSPNGSFQLQFDYYPTGELRSFTLPKAPNQYGPNGDQRWSFCRDAAGDATTILDPRASGSCSAGEPTYKIDNTFFDTGDLKSTTRPAFWQWGGPDRNFTEPSPDEILARTQSPDDVTGELPGGGDQANGSFGRVDPQQLPDLLPRKGTTRFTYNDEMQLNTVTANSLTSTLDYDSTGRPTEVTQPFDGSRTIDTALAYDLNGNLARETDGEGNATTFSYDQFDRRTQIDAPAPNAGAGTATTKVHYDDNGNVTRVDKPAGNGETYTYDGLDRKLSSADGADGLTTFGYDDAGNMNSVTSPCANAAPSCASGGSTTTMGYDGQDRLRTRTDPDGTTKYGYDGDGNLTSVDAPGAQSSPTAGLARQVETRTYDGRDMPWTDTNGSGANARTTVKEFDGNGDLRREVNPAGVDPATSLPKHADTAPLVPPTDASGDTALKTATEQASLYDYSPDGQLTTRYMPWGDKDARDGLRYRQDYAFDTLGRVQSVSSPHDVGDTADHTHTTYSYYDNDWIRTSTDKPENLFGNEKAEYQYDRTGNQTKWCAEPTGASGCNDASTRRIVTRAYYPSGDLKSRTAESSPNDANKRSYDYSYDLNANLTQFVDHGNQDHTTKAYYDGADRNFQVNEAWSRGDDTRLAYDADGNVFERQTDGKLVDPGQIASGYTGGKTADFEFDNLDRESSLVVHPDAGADPRRTESTYWASGARKQQTRINGAATNDPVRATEQFFYTDDGMLARRDRKPAGAANDAQDYSYDQNANRTKDARGTYEFSSRDQLTKWTHDSKIVTYELNGSGSVSRKCEGASCTTFSYAGDSERLLSASVDGGLPVHYCYADDGTAGHAGDLTSIQADACGAGPGLGDVTYRYDKFDRLISSTGQGQLAATGYHYDALDRRDKKCAGPCTAATQTDLSYIGLTNALSSEQRGAATTGQAQAQSRSYDYDSQLDRLGTDWKTGTGSTQYRSFKTGPDGSVEGLEGGDGVVAANETYKYDPYGADMTDNTQAPGTPPAPPPAQATSLDQAAQDNPFRFQGFYYDAGVKSYDMQAREYQPLIGRFTTPDRFESAGADYALAADPLTQDRYAFAAGNPVDNIEWDGHGAPPGDGPNQPLPRSPGWRNAANRRRVAQRQQQHSNVTAQAYRGYSHSIDYRKGTGIVPRGAAAPDPPAEPLPGLTWATYIPDRCRSHGGPYAGCAIGREPPRNYPLNVHAALTGLGFLPYVGAAADLINAGIYEAEGNRREALFSAGAAVPGIGDAAAGTRLGLKGSEKLADEAGAGLGGGTGRGLAGEAGARGGAGPVRVGQAGEDAVRSAYDIGEKVPIRVNGRARIPDGLTESTLSEVKNVKSLSYTRQLRDYVDYARRTNRQIDLYVRGGEQSTKLSGPLEDALRDPNVPIRLQTIP